MERLGIGNIPFQVNIEIPQERLSLTNDSMMEKARLIKDTYSILKDVPVCADLSRKLVGVVGGKGKRGCYPIIQLLAAQIAANNCYTDLKMGFIYSALTRENEENWAFTRWLPHV